MLIRKIGLATVFSVGLYLLLFIMGYDFFDPLHLGVMLVGTVTACIAYGELIPWVLDPSKRRERPWMPHF